MSVDEMTFDKILGFICFLILTFMLYQWSAILRANTDVEIFYLLTLHYLEFLFKNAFCSFEKLNESQNASKGSNSCIQNKGQDGIPVCHNFDLIHFFILGFLPPFLEQKVKCARFTESVDTLKDQKLPN